MISKVFMENKENNRILAQGKYINNNTWETGHPSLFFAFIFSADANSLATLGFSVINSAFKKLPLSKSFTIYYNITIENMI